MLLRLTLAIVAVATPALAQDKQTTPPVAAIAQVAVFAPATAGPAEMTTPAFELFRLAPGKTEAFMRSLADWDKVSIAGGQQATQVFLHSGGAGWDVLLYKPARVKPTPAQEAAMDAKIKELGLSSGALYFIDIREQMADHLHFDANGPIAAADWVAEIDRQRAEIRARK